MGDKLKFKEFKNIKVSTKTFVVYTNIIFNLESLFEELPITECAIKEKRWGKRKKTTKINLTSNVPPGSIITLKYKDQLRGVDLKAKTDKKKPIKKWFRNSFTVVMVLEDKNINFKICKNGMFQITGCKSSAHAEDCIKHIWDHVKFNRELYTFSKSSSQFEALFIPAMRNIDFSLGFLVDREKLARYMCNQTRFYSLLETSFGYTGVNIKVPVSRPITDLMIKKLSYQNKGEWTKTHVPYQHYLDNLSPKEQDKKLSKTRYNTFLVFHSGKVILSGLCSLFMEKTYYEFLDVIQECYDQVEERLDI